MPPGPIVLSSKADWPIWLNQIMVFAKARGVWTYANPQSTTPKSVPEPPAPRCSDIQPAARSLRDLNNDELSRWLLLSADHDMAMQRYEKVRGRLGDVHMEIIHTVSKPNQRFLLGKETPRDSLHRLADEFAPQPMSPADLRSRWRVMWMYLPDCDLDTWLGRWHFLYKEGKRLGIPEVQGEQPVFDFLGVLDMIADDFSAEWCDRFDMGEESVELPQLLKEFRDWKELNPELIVRPTRVDNSDKGTTYEVPRSSPSTTAKPVNKATSRKKPKRPGPPRNCLCGKRHFFSDCLYVVEALRPSVWQFDPSIQAKFDEKTQSDPKFKQAMQNAARNGNNKHRVSPLPTDKFARSQIETQLALI